MIGAVVDLELARYQWEEGRRSVARARTDGTDYRHLLAEVGVVHAGLTRRMGQIFTLAELAAVYESSDRWVLEAIQEAFPDRVPSAASTAADAAFDAYSRRAADYAP
jgi:hypothetical protein